MKTDNLTIQEAAFFLGVTTKTLQRWEKSGIWKPRRTKGNHRRITLEDIKALRRIKKRYKHFSKQQLYDSLTKKTEKQRTTIGLSPMTSEHVNRVYDLYRKHPDIFVAKQTRQRGISSLGYNTYIAIGFCSSLIAIPILVFLIRLLNW